MDKLVGQFIRRLDVERHYSRHTLRAYETDLGAFEAFLRGRRPGISDATVRDVRGFLAALRA